MVWIHGLFRAQMICFCQLQGKPAEEPLIINSRPLQHQINYRSTSYLVCLDPYKFNVFFAITLVCNYLQF
jgi:hypothetical protein